MANRELLDFQAEGPSPSQTLYQVVLYPYHKQLPVKNDPKVEYKSSVLNIDRINNGCVVIREWPRKRGSATFSRDSPSNPSERVIEYKDLIEGESDSLLMDVFKEKYGILLEATKIEYTKSQVV